METDILIIGGGLSGLALADKLQESGVDYQLVEARKRLGGRIMSHMVEGIAFDLGPAWFWPGQPRMGKLLTRFGMDYFEQYSQGDIVSEDRDGNYHRGRGFASMQGSYRVEGGLGELIASLATGLPRKCLHTGVTVTALHQVGNKIRAEILIEGRPKEIHANRVVLAIPPRIAAAKIEFTPALSTATTATMTKTPTWMAGQAKIIAVYPQPFWREKGLSGDASSQCGPMVEIHDASPADNGPYALFGFVGIPAEIRHQHQEELLAMAQAQLIRLFGQEMASPLSLTIQDWAQETLTATPDDLRGSGYHPAYGMPKALNGLWEDRLIFASTEVASQFGGFLEGALEAAENCFVTLGQNQPWPRVANSA